AHPLDRHFLDARRRANVCDARRPADERRQLAARTTGGPLLEGVPAREHQRDHGPGGPLPERKRSRDRDQGDGVDADVPAEQGTGHAQGQRQQDEHGAGGEDGVAGLRLSTEVKETAGGEGDEGGGGEQPLAHRPYQVFALGGRSAGRTRTRASTATQPCASPKTGFRSSSATSGISSASRARRSTSSISASASAGGRPRKPATSLPALPESTSSSASARVSGAIRNCASPISSART